MGQFKTLCDESDVPRGGSKHVEIEGRQFAVFNVDGALHVINGTCPHRGGPLGEGFLEGTVVTCPWHAWQFDVTTGASTMNPAIKQTCFACKVENGKIQVEF